MSTEKLAEKKLKFLSRHQLQYKNCIWTLLKALNWKGTEREYVEALPHFCQNLNIHHLIGVFKKLSFKYSVIRSIKLTDIDPRILPCLAVDKKSKKPMVIYGIKDEVYSIFSGYDNVNAKLKKSDNKVDLYVFKQETSFDRENFKRQKTSWLHEMLFAHRQLILQSVVLSLFYNLLLLSIPIYVMNIYDRVIGVGSYEMLFEFMIGISLVLVGLGVIHRMRSRVLSYIGAQVDKDVGNAIFSKLMYLSPQYTETASVESQIARIKDFDNIRDFFTGNLLATCLDVPFVLIFITAIYFLVGNLALVPLALIGIFALVAYINSRNLKEKNSLSSFYSSRKQEFLLEALDNLRILKQNSVLDTWEARYRDLSAQSAYRASSVSFTVNHNNSLSDLLMMFGGLSIMSFGVFQVFDGLVTPGALVATMILVWRALTPIRQFFVNYPRLKQFYMSVQALERLMDIQEEVDPELTSKKNTLALHGEIKFEQVSFRYPRAITPALVNLNIRVNPGEVLMIVGKNGSGKTSLLKLINNLYQPQAGNILIDGSDIRQINPILLRHSVSYCPQTSDLFYGTIAQNIRLADPTVSDKRIYLACELAGLKEKIQSLEHGIHTPIRDQSSSQLPSSFRKQVCLARTYIKNAKVFLLDEPGTGLDNEGDQFLQEAIKRMKGKKSVVMVTHRPSHLKLADKIIVLKSGQISAQGTPDEILPNLEKVYS